VPESTEPVERERVDMSQPVSPRVTIDQADISWLDKRRLHRKGGVLENWKDGDWGYIRTSG